MMRMLLIGTCAGLLAAPAVQADGFRIWTDTRGNRVRAELVNQSGDEVRFRDVDGQELAVRLNTLSREDVAYLREKQSTGSSSAPASSGTGSAVTADTVNTKMALTLFAQASLWGETASVVARRLRWPRESQTSAASSFRHYPMPYADVFGLRAFSMLLLAEQDRPVEVSFVFANKGDIDRMAEIPPGATDNDIRRIRERLQQDYRRVIRRDAQALESALKDLLGAPSSQRVGASARTEERASRWDWNGHSFLLAAPEGEYVLLRIVPTETLDESGVQRVRRSDIRAELARRVQRRPNGDVILTDIPMVNQGPKGYCVPATWERVLRYMGILADMYVLAMAGQTGVGGGTSVRQIEEGASSLVQRHGRTIRSQNIRIAPTTIDRTIDEGIPMMWAMFSMEELDEEITRRSRERKTVTDWQAWDQRLRDPRRNARNIRTARDRGHVCLIIGYNKQTGEVAVSDSWGPEYEERWMTFEEAQAISQGLVTRIDP